ncbi:MAG: hypothetical protein JRN62_03860 [Nitrososphaerota archaeon]|nr:hypothetical protein [Nitrososphaerota archaeon]MDG6948738.1 hypothetical protein [Nitrososphaerota archaeon]
MSRTPYDNMYGFSVDGYYNQMTGEYVYIDPMRLARIDPHNAIETLWDSILDQQYSLDMGSPEFAVLSKKEVVVRRARDLANTTLQQSPHTAEREIFEKYFEIYVQSIGSDPNDAKTFLRKLHATRKKEEKR